MRTKEKLEDNFEKFLKKISKLTLKVTRARLNDEDDQVIWLLDNLAKVVRTELRIGF